MALGEQLSLDLAGESEAEQWSAADLPDGWRLCRLDAITLPTETCDPARWFEKDFTYIDLSSIDNDLGRIISPKIIAAQDAPSRARKVVRRRDVVFATTRPYLKGIALVPAVYEGQVCSTGFCVLRAEPSSVLPEWLYYVCRSNLVLAQVLPKMRGASYPAVTDKDVLTTEVPLPPLAEQRRIVARIEELAGRIERARGLRREAIGEINAFVLKSLESIREDLLSSSSPRDQLGRITTITSGGTPSRKETIYWGGDIPWLKTGELLDGDIGKAEEYITQDGLDDSSAKLFPPGTVLIALYGQGQTRGRTGHLTIAATTNQACCAILPSPTRLEARFLQYWLRSLYGDIRAQSRGASQDNLNADMIKHIEIVLPPLAEQRRIVAYLDGVQATAEAVRRLQAESAAELAALLPAVLARAFRGEL